MIGETSSSNSKELLQWYGTPASPEFQLPMDPVGGRNGKLDVAAFREKIKEAETEIEGNVPLLVFDNHDVPRMTSASAMAYTTLISSGCFLRFCF